MQPTCSTCGSTRGAWIGPNWCQACWRLGRTPPEQQLVHPDSFHIMQADDLGDRMAQQAAFDDLCWGDIKRIEYDAEN